MKNRYIPFGYQIKNGDSVINTEQAATVQHIFYAYTEGQSFKEIAEYLTTSGTAYHFSDNSWNKNIVARMPDETPIDLLRILIWYDWEHEGVLQLATSRTANTPPGKTVSPIIYSEQLPLNRLLLDWADKKHSLSVRKITRADYLEWMLQWPPRLP